jgi:hypothetical protein
MNQAWMYKGEEAKLFNEDELEKAVADGWVDNRADACNAKPDTKASDKTKGAASGATTLTK